MAIQRVSKIDGLSRVKNILVSTYDKSGLEEFVGRLREYDDSIRFFSTGGTFSALSRILGAESNHLISVSEYTGRPEMSGGLVKTLDYLIYLGILGESYNESHRDDIERFGAVMFDMVVVNLYPFTTAVSADGADIEDARGNIDIGGPCMLRAAAKNFLRVAAVCDPCDYGLLQDEIEERGGLLPETRFRLAAKAFAHTASYDRAIADYFAKTDFSAVLPAYSVEG